MNKAFLLIAMLVIGGIGTGCMNQAAVSVKDGHYEGTARSTNPEALLDTVQRGKREQTYADAYYMAVERNGMYPYRPGPVGQFGLYCPNGYCITQPTQPVMTNPAAPTAPAPKRAPSSKKSPAEKPAAVTREEFDAVQAQAADAQNKANVSIGTLKTIRKERLEQKEATPAAPPPPAVTTPPVAAPPPPPAAPAQKPTSQQEIDEINKRAEDARKRAEAASAAQDK